MSFFSLPKGHYRSGHTSFTPDTLIDTLFDYKQFLGSADSAGAIASGPSTVKNIAVIGGGAAGLVCAYELSRVSNIRVTIYEADRVGGRMDSIYFDDPGYNRKVFEMGCMRFPPTSATLYHYLEKFKLETIPNFPDPGKVATQLYYQNSIIDWPKGATTPDNPDFKRIGKDFTSIVNSILGNASSPDTDNPSKLFDYWSIYQQKPTAENKANVVKAWQKVIDDWKDTSYYNAVYTLAQDTTIVSRAWTLEDMNKFGALGVGSGGFGPLFTVNFLEILRLFTNGLEENQELLGVGIGALVESFVNAIMNNRGKFIRDKVTSISLDGSRYSIQTRNGNPIIYDSVVVATTTRAMEFMGLTVAPASVLPQPQRVAIRNLHLMDSSKLFVLTRTKFWYAENNPYKKDLPANIQTDESLRGLYCLDYDSTDAKKVTGGKGVVLLSYVWGDDSSKLLALTPEERYNQFLSTLMQVNPLFAKLLIAQTEDVRSIDWENTGNFYGAFKLNYPGQEVSCQDAFFQFQQNQGLFLAGDSVSFVGGWLEGAMPTGVNAACAAVRYVGGQVIKDSPLTIPKDMYNYNNPPATTKAKPSKRAVKKKALQK